MKRLRTAADRAFGPVGLLVAVAVVWVVGALYLARDVWFGADDFAFLLQRRLDWAGVMEPHFEHWLAVPALLDKALFAVFGLRHFLPYVAFTIVLHAATAVLLRFVARALGVGRWWSVVPALLFLAAGSIQGAFVVLVAFNVQYTLSSALAVLALLAYLRGWNRAWLPALLLVAALAAGGGNGVILTVWVAAVVWFRDGFRRALLVAAPPAVVELAYLLHFRVSGGGSGVHVAELADWVYAGLLHAWPTDAGAVLLLGGLVATLVLRERLPEWCGFALAGLVAAVAALLIMGWSRSESDWGSPDGPQYRYMVLLFTVATVAPAVWWVGERLRPMGSRVLGTFAAVAVTLPLLASASAMYDYTHGQYGGLTQVARERAFATERLLTAGEPVLNAGAVLFPGLTVPELRERGLSILPSDPAVSEADLLATRLVLQTAVVADSALPVAAVVLDSPVSSADTCATHVFTGEDSFSFASTAAGVQAALALPEPGAVGVAATTPAAAAVLQDFGQQTVVPSAGLWHVESVVPDATITITPPKGSTLVC